MAQFTVTNLNDSGNGSLRNAIENANNTEGKDEIVFDSNLQGSIELTSDILNITESVIINGSGKDTITIDATSINTDIFNVETSGDVTISDLTLITGRSSNDIFGSIFDFNNNGTNLRIINITLINSLGETLLGTTNLEDTIIGTDNNDIIFGTANNDLIRAKALPTYDFSISKSFNFEEEIYNYIDGGGDYSVLDGDDFINGEAGNDTIEGGYGGDIINGGDGNDFLYGSYNPQFFNPYVNPTLTVSPIRGSSSFGRDESGFYSSLFVGVTFRFIFGSIKQYNVHQFNLDGDDIINGGNGDDAIYDENGSNYLEGGQGNDTIESYSDDDGNNIVGGEGDDSLIGVGILQGNTGNDTLTVIGDNSEVYGGEGDDFLVSGDSQFPQISFYVAKYYGGNGDDTIIGSDFLNGGNGNDSLIGDGFLNGGNGNDSLIGDGFLNGGNGNDSLKGDRGDDSLKGGNGNDSLKGGNGNGNDTLKGNSGNDSLKGNNGKDILIGGNGNDTLIGDRGKDKLSGNLGSDTFVVQNFSTDDDRNIILDFEDGVDKIGLSDGLTYNTGSSTDISIIGSSNSFIKNNDGVLLAVIKNISPSDLDVTDFSEVI